MMVDLGLVVFTVMNMIKICITLIYYPYAIAIIVGIAFSSSIKIKV